MKTAIIIGATGLVGGHLLRLLLEQPKYSAIKIFVRKSVGITHPKLTEYIIDFSQPEVWKDLVIGDTLFSALGTTLKKAGNKVKQYQIDYTFQYDFAKVAVQNGVKQYLLVSSRGANEHSNIFYTRMKGDLERATENLGFESVYFARPNLLVGERNEVRFMEKWGEHILNFFNAIGLLKSSQPIKGETVAKAMIHMSLEESKGIYILSSRRMLEHFSR